MDEEAKLKLGEKKTVEELLSMDAEDESLAKYKRALMGDTGDKGDPSDPRLVVLLVIYVFQSCCLHQLYYILFGF